MGSDCCRVCLRFFFFQFLALWLRIQEGHIEDVGSSLGEDGGVKGSCYLQAIYVTLVVF